MEKSAGISESTDEDLIGIAQAERDMDAGKVPYVVVAGTRMGVHVEIMKQLKLVSGQTISHALMYAITKKTLAICQQKAASHYAEKGDTSSLKALEEFWSQQMVGLADTPEFSDSDLINLAQAERDMDAGTRRFVRFQGDRLMVIPEVMAELQLEHGQTINLKLVKAIARKSLARNTAQLAIQRAQRGHKPTAKDDRK